MPKNLLNYTFWAALELNYDRYTSIRKNNQLINFFFYFTPLNKGTQYSLGLYFHYLYAFIDDKTPIFFVVHVLCHVFLPLPVKVTLKCSKLPPQQIISVGRLFSPLSSIFFQLISALIGQSRISIHIK